LRAWKAAVWIAISLQDDAAGPLGNVFVAPSYTPLNLVSASLPAEQRAEYPLKDNYRQVETHTHTPREREREREREKWVKLWGLLPLLECYLMGEKSRIIAVNRKMGVRIFREM